MSDQNESPEDVKARMRSALDVLENYVTPGGKLDGTKLAQDLSAAKAKIAQLEAELRNAKAAPAQGEKEKS